jgi:hypothetical protein
MEGKNGLAPAEPTLPRSTKYQPQARNVLRALQTDLATHCESPIYRRVRYSRDLQGLVKWLGPWQDQRSPDTGRAARAHTTPNHT